MSATTWCVVYNTSPHPQMIDEEGHVVDPGTWACARRSFVKPLTDQDLLIVVDMDTIGDSSNPAARLAKEEAVRRNEAIDAEKEKDQATPAPAKTTAKNRNDKQ